MTEAEMTAGMSARDAQHWKVRLILEFDCVSTGGPDEAARFAAESVRMEAVTLDDAECQVHGIGTDGTLRPPFYRSGVYRKALEEQVHPREDWESPRNSEATW